ncbi:glutamate synthase (NADPH) large subunit [Melghirimyces profundicolus]|uniref:Glutamate synthase (NADPH) large subunit n=1 Tax=Melghirimyces profundicolus TaxID=1242148 RepID=A0A2T6C899_9BACL|nr:glutamate synthase large subunit [Melghirimyces profundicolus]PTX64541.1 glutamate synthase (NADPH) large subunit [Melghirimyces profundicolus]
MAAFTSYPDKQGLYTPEFEHDACGIGFVANLKGKPSHDIVKNGLEILCRLVHRGGQQDLETGDGSGIMLQIPHQFFKKYCGFELPAPGEYGVGMLFLPRDEAERADCEKMLETIVEEEGQKLLGWRTVPVNPSEIGETARESQPHIRQVFIGRDGELEDPLSFERKLYVIRKQLEKAAGKKLYVASLSSRTLVYKGLLTPAQVDAFYRDLREPDFQSAFSMVHNRFSTNTFPSWERAHPNRYLLHNGEINTLRGNVNWMLARERMFDTDDFGDDLEKVLPVIDLEGSDSAILDNCFEFLALSGRSLPHVAMMMIPEPWDKNDEVTDPKEAFYEYHSCLMEPWDGPTAISFSDGRQIGAVLDRNGLRPARYYVTTEDTLIFSSEVGVVDIPPEKVAYKGRLEPGRMLLADLEEGRVVSDDELKNRIACEQPYREWLNEHLISLEDLPEAEAAAETEEEELLRLQKTFGYTYEELTKNLAPMVTEGKDPVGSMGNDTPLAVLSDRPQLLYNYFKQSFAQVTNPAIDAIREACVTSTLTHLGSEGNLLQPEPEHCRRIRLETPVISKEACMMLRKNPHPEFRGRTLSILFPVEDGAEGMKQALDRLFAEADRAIEEGVTLLFLSDRGVDEKHAAIPALLATSGLHHHLVRRGTRTQASLIIESGEPRDVHHFSMLIGYGADVVCPYLALDTLNRMVREGAIPEESAEEAVKKYIRTATDGIVKVMSKMGISTVQSYRGAQIFEAIGIDEELIDRYFTRTTSQIGGIGLDVIAKETLMRHEAAHAPRKDGDDGLDPGSELQWRRNGEYHAFNPITIHTLQQACRRGDFDRFRKFSKMVDEENLAFLRGLLEFTSDRPAVPLDEVEPVESIVRRFKTGAMSYGALSQEAHEVLAIAMNRIGGKSNSGEGGEDPVRFTPDENGDLRRSAIKQVASGRFGVSSHYLVNADEIQIKIAQGAKPGEGGQLPGNKVYPWIAEVRGSIPGVGLISPPPHHDIYSIEDLAQLIHDLKNANPEARISVKLVSKPGVGTIAAGVAKGLADVIVISGYEGGTGASPRTSIRHAGMPWELGLAETHQTLLLNRLRDRVALETDGKMMTGRDVVVAALLGAEEFGFATAPLVVMGCVMMRACHLDTCPVGVATQNPELRKKFVGDPDHVVNFMKFVAQEVREIMAALGFRRVEEMIGRSDVLKVSERAKTHWKAKHLDLSRFLYRPDVPEEVGRYHRRSQDHRLEESLDRRELLPLCEPALESGERVEAALPIRSTDRVVGTILGHEVTKRYGAEGLPEDTIRLHFRGSAGQSFGAFVPKGITLSLEGDANDYIGKGLSGGKIAVRPPETVSFDPEKNVVIGNVAFYGATAGEAYIRGIAGERFCVRNSGVRAVVEGVGDHGCEYMTGGRVVILGDVGKNFAAGMSGGIAYVLADDLNTFAARCNPEMVLLETLDDDGEVAEVERMIRNHVHYTGSRHAERILDRWDESVSRFVKVIPKDYKQMLESIEHLVASGMDPKEAIETAFESKKRKKPVHPDPDRKKEPVLL